MADLIDISNDYSDLLRDNNLKRHVNRDKTLSTGICIDCSEHIDVKRLEIHPHEQRCIDCQTHHELRLKQQGGKLG